MDVCVIKYLSQWTVLLVYEVVSSFDELIVLLFCKFVNIKIEKNLKNIKLSENNVLLKKVKSVRNVLEFP